MKSSTRSIPQSK